MLQEFKTALFHWHNSSCCLVGRSAIRNVVTKTAWILLPFRQKVKKTYRAT
jgi:hypothetical protein